MPGHRTTAVLRLDPEVLVDSPKLAGGLTTPENRSWIYRFKSLDSEDSEPLNFMAVIKSCESISATAAEVELWFLTEMPRVYATPGASFEILYPQRIGEGEITGVVNIDDTEGQEPLRNFDLSDEQRRLLRVGLNEWGGPSRCTEAMAKALGFVSVQDLFDNTSRITERIRRHEPLSETDWARALLATEVCFSSSLGSTIDWEITTGFTDGDTIRLIRELQYVLVDVTRKLRNQKLF